MARTSLYFALMAAAAAASLLRGFVVAALLAPEDFTVYAVAVAIGTLLSNLLSFGLIEATVKQFPRIAIGGGAPLLMGLAAGSARKLALRAVLGLPLFALVMLLVDRERPLMFLAVAAIALGAALLGLLASMQRALLNVMNVALANGARALFYLSLAALGAYCFGLKGAIAGEVVAALAGALASREIFKRTLRHAPPPTTDTATAAPVLAQAGITVFMAYTALAVPTYLDRAYVAGVFSAAEGAAYAVLALFATGAAVFVNIVAQKVGPEIIARERLGAKLATLLAIATRWSLAALVVWAAAIGVVAWAESAGMFPFLEKYALTGPMFMAILVLGCMQVASLFEFIIIARDRERLFLALTFGYLVAVCGLATYVASGAHTLVQFIYLLALARLVYFAALLIALATTRKEN